MRPPECAICGKEDFDLDEGGIIYFMKRPSDEEWDKKMEEKGWVGHPPYAEWFCEEHYPAAKKMAHLTIDKALKKLREQFARKE
ncbi:MAG: hypothetical protein GF308_05865 [Candidatus Heimdallarchaeota archaeon]|nr:hypothetical protein [Candidatus Heimdallarchaeota archaeon]